MLATMNEIVPWRQLCEVIEPHYPKVGSGRPPVGLKRILRMYFVQHWFNLADEACEEALLDSAALRRFVGIDLGRERVPDGTTLLRFRPLLEAHGLGQRLWGFTKVRYRGLTKNATRSFVALGLANSYLARRQLYGQVHAMRNAPVEHQWASAGRLLQRAGIKSPSIGAL